VTAHATSSGQRRRLLVVDDDVEFRSTLHEMLDQAGFDVSAAADSRQMTAALAQEAVDLVLLDLRLRGEDGLTLARHLRERSAIPVIMMSGRSDETDRVLGLELAADDFLVKPFSARELIARVRAVLRRTQAGSGAAAAAPEPPPASGVASLSGEVLAFGRWKLYLDARELVDEQGQRCALTQAEYRLLEAFVRQPGTIWTRDRLLEHTRSLDTEVYDRAIDVLILRLRRKIEPNPKHPQYIVTERGQGYLFGVQVRRL
jgi:two-component system, OmpR family, response regulator